MFFGTPVVSGLCLSIAHDSMLEEEDEFLVKTPAGEAEAAGHGNVEVEASASNATNASSLAFLRSFLHDVGVVSSEPASWAELRQEVMEHVTSHPASEVCS